MMKREVPAVVKPIVSGFRRLTRGSSPLCVVGAFAFSLTRLAIVGPAPEDVAAVRPPLQAPAPPAAGETPKPVPAEAARPAPPGASEAPKTATADAPKPVPETSKPAPAPQPTAAAPAPATAAAEKPADPKAQTPTQTQAPVSASPAASQAALAPAAVHPQPSATVATVPAAPVAPQPATPAPAPIPAVDDKIERLQKAADLLMEVNTALGVPRSPYGQIIYDIAVRHSINPHVVAALINVESAFNPKAKSPKGAIGLMQLLPETARRFGVSRKRDLLDPSKNLEAGVKYLKWLTDRFGGDVQKILAAYNAGEGAVDRFGGIPPYQETQRYVQKIFGLLGLTPEPPPAPAAVVPAEPVPAGR